MKRHDFITFIGIRMVILTFLFINICSLGFAQSTSETKELGYIIFAPDTAIFENEVEAKNLLDQYAKSINSISSYERQIHINGWTAIFDNDIDPLKLSTERANVILNELQLRGISKERLDIAKGNGGTNIWGNNNIPEERKLNRRVIISIDEYKEILPAVSSINSSEETKTVNDPINNVKQEKQGLKINWKKVLIVVAIIVAIIVIILLIVYVIAPALGAGGAGATGTAGAGGIGKATSEATRNMSKQRIPKIKTPKVQDVKSSTINNVQKQGGYFGELKYQIRDLGQDGTKAVHHMPCDTALFNANKLDHGSAPAIIMDTIDHAKTASFGSSMEATAYQTKQLELVNAGKFDEALQMDIDDLIKNNLYQKYKTAIDQMLEYVKTLKNEGRL